MSYDFNYDPNTGETPWPMKWTVAPSQYNWEGTLGDTISFSVKAIPDPDYPSAWNDNYTTETSNPDGTTSTTLPPPLPPEPVLSEYTYSSSSSLEKEFVSLTLENGLVLDNLGTELFFPYDNITYFKNDVKKSAQFPQEVIDDDFDYVSALVPSDSEFIIKTSTISAISTSKNNLTGTFQFKIDNEWQRAQDTLETLSVYSKEYFTELVGDALPEVPNLPQLNTIVSGALSNDLPPVDDLVDDFKEKYDKTYDDFFRTTSEVDINNIVGDTTEFLDDLKNDTISEAVDTVEGYVDTAQGTVSSINDAIRDGNIEELMTKFGYTYDEVMNLFKGI